MKNTRKKAVAVVIILALMLVGCGSKEVAMKEFTSDDQTVSIQLNEEWSKEDMGDGSEGWIGATSKNGTEGVVVMQVPKNLYGVNVSDMDSWKEYQCFLCNVRYEIDRKSVCSGNGRIGNL